MKYAMDVKVNLRPVFSNLVHTDWWEGPCRVGIFEENNPTVERRAGKEQFKIWFDELKANIDSTRCNLLEPIYLEYDESFVVPETEFSKLRKENHLVDIYLITYRVPGIERLGKPVSMINLGPTPIDVVGFYKDIGLEAYMAHDYSEYNEILKILQVRKAVANTKILILSNCEQTPFAVNTSTYDLTGLFMRYGISNNRIDFRQVFEYMDKIEVDDNIRTEARAIIKGADKCDLTEEFVCNDFRYFHAVRKMMEKYDCNAFTTACKELCASRIPQKLKFTPCLTHTINKDDRIPSACEEDMAALMAMIVMMYLTRQSVYMGNPVLVIAGSKTIEQLGMPKLLEQPDMIFDRDVLEIHHAVPVRKMRGFDKEPQSYTLSHFTTQGWGTHLQVNMAEEEGQVVTFGRFNRRGTKMMVAVGHTLGCEFRPYYCSPAVYYDVEGGVREFRQALAEGSYGHHQAIVYGNHVKEIQKLGKVMGFEVEYFH